MKKETLKEVGKLFFDSFKIVVAVAIVAPLVKSEDVGVLPIALSLPLILVGIYLANKGAKDE